MNLRSLAFLGGLVACAGCGDRADPPNADRPLPKEIQSNELTPDNPDVVRSVEAMLTKDVTEAQQWVESHQPSWADGIKRIYDSGVKRVVIYERDEDFVGRVPVAIIVDRGDVGYAPAQSALADLLSEQRIRDHGWTTTSRYTVVFLY